MSEILEFLSSLGLVGYFVLVVLILCIINFRKVFSQGSVLKKPSHTSWKDNHGYTKPDDYSVGFNSSSEGDSKF